MAEFRLYFCDSSDHIIARLEFRAGDDGAALAIAATIAEACTDRHCGYMLWQEKRLVYSSREAGELQVRRFSRAAITIDRQDEIVRLEEGLLNSHWCIARSVRLLEATTRLRAERDQHAGEHCARDRQLAS